MKKSQLALCFLLGTIAIPACAFSQEKASSLSALLVKYYSIKNALVLSDAASAAKAAGDFVSYASAVDPKSLASNEQATFKPLQAPLLADANRIAAATDVAKQRVAFQTLSTNLITLSKSIPVSKPAYVAYCPMKKAFWISDEQRIANPYYGAGMLSCGKITETIK